MTHDDCALSAMRPGEQRVRSSGRTRGRRNAGSPTIGAGSGRGRPSGDSASNANDPEREIVCAPAGRRSARRGSSSADSVRGALEDEARTSWKRPSGVFVMIIVGIPYEPLTVTDFAPARDARVVAGGIRRTDLKRAPTEHRARSAGRRSRVGAVGGAATARAPSAAMRRDADHVRYGPVHLPSVRFPPWCGNCGWSSRPRTTTRRSPSTATSWVSQSARRTTRRTAG